ncbi:MAG: NifB/NifX family molybdenum-iron cluster-binding protein [Candidatus Wukongarchaeota archaeon]|nr:NifB/NifX family molybdenum-iron cluster-binding protein [Candidatus Wukongarchaeota archaeon]MDO8127991.1 NifB/NifX family molybdenum-iron cluster-binding protein [Candidatus Wukongarchaeota archaeon]
MVKIVIPVDGKDSDNARIFPHIGKAPFFASVEISDEGKVEKITYMENKGQHFGGRGRPAIIIAESGANALIVKNMGPRGINMIKSHGIKVLTCKSQTLKEAINEFLKNETTPLEEPCKEAEHPF